MNQRTNQILFALLRSAIYGSQLRDDEKALFSEEMLPELLSISKKHDIAHLIGVGLDLNSLLPIQSEDSEKFSKYIMTAIFRHERLNYELGVLRDGLAAICVPFVPLKGAVLCKFYPTSWMRTSCDIDILVNESDLEKVVAYFCENYGYTAKEKDSHDISLFSPRGIHVELHYDLIEEGRANFANEVLKKVWSNVSLKENYGYLHEMTDEFFYFYHIAHMAKHFEIGGCGIRPFIDLWILDNLDVADQAKRDSLLAEGGLLKFAEAARRLSHIWFGGEVHDVTSAQMETYILRGGVYGTEENRIVVQQQKKGGRFRYILSRVFIPYDIIKYHYPILQKHRWLTPFMEVRRWFKLAFCGHAKRSMQELKYNQAVSESEAAATKAFLDDIGL